jgi:large subunit ribosomal protein L29
MPEGKLSEIRQNLRQCSDEELLQELQKTKDNLFTFRYQAATHQLENVMRIRQERKHIARIRTLQRERELQSTR